MRSRPERFLVVLLGLTMAPGFPAVPEAAAQVTTLDEGSFRIWVNGAEAGTETFSIRRSSAAADAPVIAQGEIRLNEPDGPVQLRPALQLRPGLDASGAPLLSVTGYQVEIVGAGEQRVTVEPNGDRFRATVLSAAGERQREFRATPGTLVLDSGVIHQFYFLARRFLDGAGAIPIVVPRAGRQVEMRLQETGRESIEIGGIPLPARRLRAGQGADAYELWVDDAGRVLRVEQAVTGLVAVREGAPAAG